MNMDFFKRTPAGRRPMPAWAAWLSIAFVVFAVFSLQQPSNETKSTPLQETVHAMQERKILSPSGYRAAWNPQASRIQIKDSKKGNGLPALCGQTATITYTATLTDDTSVDTPPADTSLVLALKSGSSTPHLVHGLLGMQAGGERTLVVPSADSQNATRVFNIRLLALTPDLGELQASAFRVIDTRQGGEKAITCGEEAALQVTLWDVRGKKIYETTRPLRFIPGNADVFIGLEQGALGLRVGGARTLIIPPAFQKNIDGTPPAASFHLPKNETVIADIAAVNL